MQPQLIQDVTDENLTPQEGVLLRHLIDHYGERLRKDELVDAVFGHREDGGPISVRGNIRVLVCRLRKKLRPGWEIYSRKRRGFWLVYDPEGWGASEAGLAHEKRIRANGASISPNRHPNGL